MERDILEDLGVGGRLMLKLIFKGLGWGGHQLNFFGLE
jgi:hypothetical protein